ncbi:Kinesin motor domain [Carpediemonas membranifera]|uniref:Kinesin motor domain n=1 Tax=Carpediemonas membranifera TaxID=201153 RepID=A0A8J6E2G5_9EUKA|nr:Kinesin motor domain [Carpediemonas membranifera]|eukprot:KAG9397614.1 Kinesin motor domain [Carpediemonas membranifera]
MTKDDQRLKVFIRVRPPIEDEVDEDYSFDCSIDGYDTMEDREDSIVFRPPRDVSSTSFSFNGVFSSNASQSLVFSDTASHLVDQVLQGYNGTLLAYGQTGTGKTYTMGILNTTRDYSIGPETGIIPRCLTALFDGLHLKQREGSIKEWRVYLSFLQIYNESVTDLLAEEHKSLEMFESGDRFMVEGLTQWAADNVTVAMSVVNRGLETVKEYRAATAMNEASSRSHTILAATVEQLTADDTELVSDLTLVDLAGSERARKSKSRGDRSREAGHINKSLSELGNVIDALIAGRSHVPYRNCKLTKILAHGLGGDSRTVLIATVGPSARNADETKSTLMFAARCSMVRNNAALHETVPLAERARRLEESNAALKLELEQLRAENSRLAEENQATAKLGPIDEESVDLVYSILTSTHDKLRALVYADRGRAEALSHSQDDLIAVYGESVAWAADEMRMMAQVDPLGDPDVQGQFPAPSELGDAVVGHMTALGSATRPHTPAIATTVPTRHPAARDLLRGGTMMDYTVQLGQWMEGLVETADAVLRTKDESYAALVDNMASELGRLDAGRQEVANWALILDRLLKTNGDLKGKLSDAIHDGSDAM